MYNCRPFASLIDYVSDNCVRLLINRDKVGKTASGFLRSMMFGEGLCFDLPGNRRDVAYEGDCDDGCLYLADQLGFGDELRQLVKEEHEKIVGGVTKEVTEDLGVDEEKAKLLKEEDTKLKSDGKEGSVDP